MHIKRLDKGNTFSNKLDFETWTWQQSTWAIAQKTDFSVKNFFSKCERIHNYMQICLDLLKKTLRENLIFYVLSAL